MILLSELIFRGLENILDNYVMNLSTPCLLNICSNELQNASMPFTSHFLYPMVQLLFCILKNGRQLFSDRKHNVWTLLKKLLVFAFTVWFSSVPLHLATMHKQQQLKKFLATHCSHFVELNICTSEL